MSVDGSVLSFLLPFYSLFATQTLGICVSGIPTNSVHVSIIRISMLTPPTVVSDLLSHSRRNQRAEPTLQGLAMHSGNKADGSSKCLFAYRGGLLLSFPFFSVLPPSNEWQCPQNHIPSELGRKTFSPGISPNLSGTHIFF